MNHSSQWLNKRLKHQFHAASGMLIGTMVIVFTMLYLNNLSSEPPKKNKQKSLSFEVIKQVKTPKKPKPTPKKLQPKNQSNPVAAPPAFSGLGMSLSGIDINMNAFDPNSEMPEAKDQILGDTTNAIMTSDTVDQEPRAVSRAPLNYPPRAKAKEIEGFVLLSILVNEQGDVEQVRVLESEPRDTFEEVAIRNIKKWKFEPALYNGEPVKIWVNQPIQFRLG
jgi:protein TonB